MLFWEYIIIGIFGLLSLIFFIKSLREIRNKKNAYGLTPYLFFLGSFVWGDMIILGPFWILVSIVSTILNNFNLFLLFTSIFWTIRSLGEVIYWLNEQFAEKKHNPPHTLSFYFIIKSDAIWFIYQVFWQCVFVFSLILSIYLCKIWLQNV